MTLTTSLTHPRRLVRALYDWTVQQANKPYATWLLFAVAFAESSVFPLPPDIMLLPMCIAQPARALRFALVCTIGSVLGGLLGYAIGAALYETAGRWIIDTYHMQVPFQKFSDGFQEWGVWIILIKGVLPIPYKLVTIASGVAHLDLIPFVLASLATRGMRFGLVALAVVMGGTSLQNFIERHLNWIALAVIVAIIVGFGLVLH